jgi:uncharacterized membrane protein
VTFEDTIKLIGRIMEVFGVAVIVVGITIVSGVYLFQLRLTQEGAYREYRKGLGRSILLGLEILVAGDIIRTVAIEPTFTSVGVLAVIVAVRTFLSWSLEVELHGRWPWSRGMEEGEPGHRGGEAATRELPQSAR